jgi:hypothetical protein
MRRVIDGKLYDTEKATLLADNEFSDGTNPISHGRATYLYKTKKGNFFALHVTQWQGEHDTIEACPVERAKQIFQQLDDSQSPDYEEVFGAAEEA